MSNDANEPVQPSKDILPSPVSNPLPVIQPFSAISNNVLKTLGQNYGSLTEALRIATESSLLFTRPDQQRVRELEDKIRNLRDDLGAKSEALRQQASASVSVGASNEGDQ